MAHAELPLYEGGLGKTRRATLNPTASLQVPFHGPLSESDAAYLQGLVQRVTRPGGK